jgi:hypothetical protein
MKKIKKLSLLLLIFVVFNCSNSDNETIYPENLFGAKYYHQEFVPKEESSLDDDSTVDWYLTFINTTLVEEESIWVFGSTVIDEFKRDLTYTYANGFGNIDSSGELLSFKIVGNELIVYEIYSSQLERTSDRNDIYTRVD